MIPGDLAAPTYSAEAAAVSRSPLKRAMQRNPMGAVPAYGIVISFAGTPKPLRRILQIEQETLAA